MKAYSNPGDWHREYLEELFYVFNEEHPEDFYGHSLSVGDVVVIGETAWFCAPVGWEPCSAPVSEKEEK